MDIKVVPYGPLGSNMYLVSTSAGLIVVDPSVDPCGPFVARKLSTPIENVKVCAILLTHAHFDHCMYLDAWAQKTSAPSYLAAEDIPFLKSSELNCSYAFGEPHTIATVPAALESELTFGAVSIRVLKTPGHTPGSVCFLFEKEKVMFSGDTLFAGSIGRSDLPEGNAAQLTASLHSLRSLPDDIVVYPGHGYHSTMKIEKATNPFF